jgi:hypothetical protein
MTHLVKQSFAQPQQQHMWPDPVMCTNTALTALAMQTTHISRPP